MTSTSPSKPELERVRRAARRRSSSSLEYRAAIVDARAAGLTLEEIARAAGTTRQAVFALTRRAS